jgi:uncharacterized membrane protein|tara:strand:+ start:4700 stop:4933 length:234 start_codon:yes stop_codon:yes gene_type:complete
MDLLYNNKLIVSISVGVFIAALYYNFNKIDNKNETNNKDYTLAIGVLISVFMYSILYKTEDNVNDVISEIDVGDPDF